MPPCLPALIGGTQAARYFSRPRLRNLYGRLAPEIRIAVPGAQETRVPPFVERLWMPAYAICLHASSKNTKKLVWTSVEGISGDFTLMECVNELAECELNEDAFPPAVDEARAVELARKGLLGFTLVQRGQLGKPAVDEVREIRPYYFPVWVFYRFRARKRIDLSVLDARTGKSAGAKMRVSVVNALVRARKAEQG